MSKSIKHEPCSNSQTLETNTMALDFNTLLKLIPTFDTTHPQQVYRFIRSCDSAFSLACKDDQKILLVYALNNITGTGASDVHCRQNACWEDLKSYLIEKFSNVKTIAHLNLELQSMFQKPGESLTDYFHRVDLCRSKIVEKLNTEISDTSITGRILTTEETALSVFVNGVNTEIGTMLRTKGFSSLSEAGRFAMQEDKIRMMNVARQMLFKSTNNNKIKMTSQSNFSRQSFDFRQNASLSNTKVCSYCKNIGHLISECRKRAYNNSIRTNTSPTTRPPIQRALPAPTSASRVNNLNSDATKEESNFLEIATASCSTTQLPASIANLQLE